MAKGHFWNASDSCLTYKQVENRKVVRNGYMGGVKKKWRKLCFKTIWIVGKQLTNKPRIKGGGRD